MASVLRKEERRKDARRISCRCGSCTRLSALRLPSFKGGVFWTTLLGLAFLDLAFLGLGKARMRRGIATTNVRMSQNDISQRTSGHFQRTGYGAAKTHAKLSRAAHARRVAGAPIAPAQRFGPACAVRFAGIVPLLHQQALPPGAHMLRRRPGRVRLEALVPQEGQAQDAAAGMEPARAPQVAVARMEPTGPARSGRPHDKLRATRDKGAVLSAAPRIALRSIRATVGPPPRPLRRGVRSGISELCSAGSPPLHGMGVLGYVRAELCRSRASWRAPLFTSFRANCAVWPL